jgi:hypothetical protein
MSHRSAGEGEGDDGVAGAGGVLFGFRGDAGFEVFDVEVDFAGGDLFFGCAVEAEFADAESGVAGIIFGTKRGTKYAAGHGTRGVEVAESGGGIEDGTGLVVGEAFELAGASFVDEAGVRIAGKIGRETGGRLTGALANGGGAIRIGGVEGSEAFAETGGVKLRDGKDADAALGASWSAEKESAGAAGGVGNSGIDDVDELGIARGEHGFRIVCARGDEKIVMWERYAAGSEATGCS